MIKALSLPAIFFKSKPEVSIAALRVVKSKTKTEKTFHPAIFFTLIAFNVVIGMAYILGVNSYAATGYEIKKSQSQLEKLVEENKKLSLQVSESSSIVSAQANLPQMNFVAAGTPRFLEISPVMTAMK
jgi:cell division protein FtsL